MSRYLYYDFHFMLMLTKIMTSRMPILKKFERLLLLMNMISLCLIVLCNFYNFSDPKKVFSRYIKQRRLMTCTPTGRFGNLLFNYAALLGIAYQNNYVPIIGENFQLRESFNISIEKGGMESMSMPFVHREYGGRASAYDPTTRNFIKDYEFYDIVLVGYYQSWRYFSAIESLIRREFALSKQNADLAVQYISKFSLSSRKVAVHVRRGDILSPEKQSYGYVAAPASYIYKAMRKMREKYIDVVFIVGSDDIAWCQKNIKEENVNFLTGNSYIVDFAILSMCDDTIMTVGSFGWWIAWLVNGTTFYYGKWPRPVSQLEYRVAKKDYFPSKWIPLS